jgi:hypothetical protein
MKKRKVLTGRRRRQAIMQLAEKFDKEGELELDKKAVISEGDDNGAYVQMWQWVPFGNTGLCKGEGSGSEGKVDGDHDDCDDGCPVIDAIDLGEMGGN